MTLARANLQRATPTLSGGQPKPILPVSTDTGGRC